MNFYNLVDKWAQAVSTNPLTIYFILEIFFLLLLLVIFRNKIHKESKE